LHRALIDYDLAMLRTLARNRGVALETNVQTEAVDRLAGALAKPLSVRTAVARLSAPARQALDQLLAGGGRMRASQFTRTFGEIRRVGPGRLEREAPWLDPASAAEELWYAGLIYRTFGEDEAGTAEFVYVPTDVQPLLPGTEQAGASFPVEVVAAPEDAGRQEPTLVEDVFQILVLIQNREVRPYADGRLAQRDLAVVRARLLWAGERRLALARRLTDQLGLASRDREAGILRLDSGRAKRWLTAQPAEQLAALQKAWHDDASWKDLCRVPGIECEEGTAWHQRYDATAARRALLSLLARCPHDAWWTLDSFVAAVKAVEPDFQRPGGDYRGWYVRDASSGEYLSGFESWEQVEGALITDVLTGVLHWLGAVALAPQPGGTACRLTEAGLRFLGVAAATPGEVADAGSPASPPVAVRPDFSVHVPPPASLYTRFQLERFAEPETPPPGEDGHIYRLHVGALGRALSRGIRVDQILAFLEQVSGGRVPANVAGQLQLWAGRHGQVELDEVALLRVESERTMRELAVLPETRSLIGRQISPTTALVRKEHLARLRKALRDLGYLLPEE
jgi:hypothetical protein